MGWRDFQRKVKRQFSEAMELPGDVVLNLPKIIMIGNIQLFIENHRGIIEYTTEGVRVSVGEGEVAVVGENLMLRNILPDELCVEGKIRSLSFL
ncbi:YabP family protein [Pelotomaculum schinkii]|uniref:YabP family protein n=1 Tax=Pelotomaculum schinkii TaxID=78350 RepID=A0A4Y7RDX8_9FIRM|nr:sporulation protein YqfC [Pelotomaculum schinkii]TEB07218.1 YabP family protein [Pelotomaculum schinkii]